MPWLSWWQASWFRVGKMPPHTSQVKVVGPNRPLSCFPAVWSNSPCNHDTLSTDRSMAAKVSLR